MPKTAKSQIPAVLTIEEMVLEAKSNHTLPVPLPKYAYSVGESVIYGHLLNVRVEQLFDDGRYILLSHHQKGSANHKAYDNGQQLFGVKAWFQLSPKAARHTENFALPVRNLYFNVRSLGDLMGQLDRHGVVDSPVYQRDYVWTEADKQALIGSMLAKRDIGKVVLLEQAYADGGGYEILDGKQRIQALRAFLTGEFQYKGFYHWELSQADQATLEDTPIPVSSTPYKQLTELEKLELFLSVNAAGVPQTAEHLNRVQNLLLAEKQKRSTT